MDGKERAAPASAVFFRNERRLREDIGIGIGAGVGQV
jgi:hypothetical protein